MSEQKTKKLVKADVQPEEEEAIQPSKYKVITKGGKRYVLIPVKGHKDKEKELYTQEELQEEIERNDHKKHNYNFYVEDKHGFIISVTYRCKDDRTLELPESETVSEYSRVANTTKTISKSPEKIITSFIAYLKDNPLIGIQFHNPEKDTTRPPIYVTPEEAKALGQYLTQVNVEE